MALGDSYPLLDALIHRRSRRFAKGLRLEGGPLAYASGESPDPLTLEEEAALTFAACGVTGYALAELPYESAGVPETGGGHIMARFVGRTIASPDALHNVTLFLMNDEGTWMIRRPQDYPRGEIADLVRSARERRVVELFEKARVRIADERVDVPREPPFVPSFNKWSANRPGTSYFLPVNELSAMYINIMLSAFDDDFAYYVVDERNRFAPAGVARFARSRGGHLNDDPDRGRVVSVGFIESWLCELAAIEHGMMMQNLGLMTQALALGGFPHFTAHPFGWVKALGFQMQDVSVAKAGGMGTLVRSVLRVLGKDAALPHAVALEHDGQRLLHSYCPPCYPSMETAVRAFVDAKFAEGSGAFRDGGEATGWRDAAAVQARIPRYSDKAIDATIAYCEYVYGRYGRFPALSGPFRTVLAHQAHRLDPAFYSKFYRPDALGAAP